MTGGDGSVLFLDSVAISEHVATENQSHALALPIRLAAISFQSLPDRSNPSASLCPGTCARRRPG